MKSIIFATILALASAAQLPSKTYLPQAGPAQPSTVYFKPISISGIQGTYHQSFGHASYQGSSSYESSNAVNTRPQQEVEKNAAVVKQDQDINENGFHYSFETSNGIRAEEVGNTAQTQGSFSYKGDNGLLYTIVYTAGEDGFKPVGDHIPVPPPIPQAILDALKQNEKDEAAGIFDDGKYHSDHENSGKPGSTGSNFASGQTFASTSHQETFNGNTGYRY